MSFSWKISSKTAIIRNDRYKIYTKELNLYNCKMLVYVSLLLLLLALGLENRADFQEGKLDVTGRTKRENWSPWRSARSALVSVLMIRWHARETGAQELQKLKVWWELKKLWLGLAVSQANSISQQQICNDICELQHHLVLHCPLSLKTTWLLLPFCLPDPIQNVPCGPWDLEKRSWKPGSSSAQLTQCRYVYNE